MPVRTASRGPTPRWAARRRPRARHVFIGSFICLALVTIAFRMTAQQLVNASEITIERFALTRPMGDGAEASIDAKLVLPRIGFGAALRGTELVLNYRDQPCGRLTAREPILLGDGGEARFQLHGALSVTEFGVFKQLAGELLVAPNLTLGLRGGLTLGVPPLPLPVGAVLEREVAMKGASGLDVRIVHFSFRDGQPREFPGRPSPLPLVLEIHVEVNNPSSFDFSPLGQLQLGIASASGLRFAMVRTDSNVDLPPGMSNLSLSGELAVADEDLERFGPLLGDYIQGQEIPLQSIFLSSTEPLYHKALGGIPITAALPGLLTNNQPARIFERVKLDINAFEDAYSLARRRDLHDYCYIEGTNPLNVSLTFYKIEVDIFYDGEWIGDVHVPWLDTPINMSAYQQRYTPPVRFPVRLSASTTTVLSMFERLMLPNGLIYVDVAVNLTFSAGNQVYTMPHYDTGVEVSLHL
mmetsp:Transcript_6470/g.19426  ORF Transcript_6470/g.19426 Transcript_6470/m.19426 type:complete len:468 (+) Transcript_6470:360-1763(+)